MPQLAGPLLSRVEVNHDLRDPLYLAAVAAVVNALVAGRDTAAVKPERLLVAGIDHDRLREIFKNAP